MKLIFLNCWGGKLKEPLSAFLANHKNTTDVFCFQEANGNMPGICKEILPEYRQINGYKYVSEYDEFPMLSCVRPGIKVIASGTVLQDIENTGLGVYTQLEEDRKVVTILNAHGVSRPGDKLDTPERLKQSEVFIAFMAQQPGTRIIGGDFNLLPETESVKIFEKRIMEKYRQIAEGTMNQSLQPGETLVDFTVARDIGAARRLYWVTFFFGVFSFFTQLWDPDIALIVLTNQRLILVKMNYLGQIRGNVSYQLNAIQTIQEKSGFFIDFMFKFPLRLNVGIEQPINLRLAAGNYTEASRRIISTLNTQTAY